jgi:hypothetical protein
MPSPFPGMDPYLENPITWSGVHHPLITYISDALNPVLSPRYVANIGERLYIIQPERGIIPDVYVKRRRSSRRMRKAQTNGTAQAMVIDPPLVLTAAGVEIREGFIEIRQLGERGRVVTAIEVLSLSNKTRGQKGQQLYLAKQERILKSRTHLIEIDLHRRGEHTVAVPQECLLGEAVWDYLVCLHRGERGDQFEVWPITLRNRLPRISVPLAAGDPDVGLDLQEILDRCYDAGRYEDELDYRRDPKVPLSKADAAWARTMLRKRGLR